MKILFLSHTPATGVFRVGSHHLARELRKRGHRVVHLSSPVTLAHLGKLTRGDIRRRLDLARWPMIEAGVLHGVPRGVLPLNRGPSRIRKASVRLTVRDINAYLRLDDCVRPDVVFVDQPQFVDVLAGLEVGLVIYRPTDVHDRPPLSSAEVALGDVAQAVVATSQFVMDSLPEAFAHLPRTVLPNGVEFARFLPVSCAKPRIGAVYVGAVDGRFDWRSLGAMADILPGCPFDIYGPVSVKPSDLPRNVALRGPLHYSELPNVLSQARVGLLPFTRSALNRGRSPMKLFEYLASGLNVVASRSPTLDDLAAPGVFSYVGEHDVVDAAREAIALGVNVAGREVAKQYDWSISAERLESFVSKLTGRAG